jgi:hypothetical protein
MEWLSLAPMFSPAWVWAPTPPWGGPGTQGPGRGRSRRPPCRGWGRCWGERLATANQRPDGEGRRLEGQSGCGGDEEIADPERGEGVEATTGEAAVVEGQHDDECGNSGGEITQLSWNGKSRGQLVERQSEEEGDTDLIAAVLPDVATNRSQAATSCVVR